MITRGKTNSLKPRRFPNYQVYHTAVPVDLEPTYCTQAIKHSNWRQAMANELTTLAFNGTWDLVLD
jgi:hypothetical protein